MITGVHTLIYSDDVVATRDFFRDVLQWSHVDVHDGWLIFRSGPSELAIHPTSMPDSGDSGAAGRHHEISLMCDDLTKTVAELTARGAEFTRAASEERWGLTISLSVPGAGELLLYQPKHPLAYDL